MEAGLQERMTFCVPVRYCKTGSTTMATRQCRCLSVADMLVACRLAALVLYVVQQQHNIFIPHIVLERVVLPVATTRTNSSWNFPPPTERTNHTTWRIPNNMDDATNRHHQNHQNHHHHQHHQHHGSDVAAVETNAVSSLSTIRSNTVSNEQQQQQQRIPPTPRSNRTTGDSLITTATTATTTTTAILSPPPTASAARTATAPSSSSSSSSPWTSTTAWKVSRYYCWMSALGALCAILVVAPPNSSSSSSSSSFTTTTTSLMTTQDVHSANRNVQRVTPPTPSPPTTTTTSTGTSSNTASTIHWNTCSHSGGGNSNNNHNNNNILSNALSSLTTSTLNHNNNHVKKSMPDPNDTNPVCTTTTSSSRTTESSDRILTLAVSTVTGTTTTTDETEDHTGWFRGATGWWTFSKKDLSSKARNQQQPYNARSSHDYDSHHSNTPLLPSVSTTNDHKNLFQSVFDVIWMKHPPILTTNTDDPRQTPPSSDQTVLSSKSSMVSSVLQVLLFSWLDPNLIFTMDRSNGSSDDNDHRNHQYHHHPYAATTTSSSFPFDTIMTNLIDKVLTSTIRLILIANWLMALTVLLHTAVADYFLGNHRNSNNHQQRRNSNHSNAHHHHHPNNVTTNHQPTTAAGTTNTHPRTATSTASRERMGGYLLFKFLLISAMVAPDTFDLLILLSWYTVLSFLRSLASLCIQQIDTCRLLLHSVPQVGVVQLLYTVFCLDIMAAMTCIGLFHGAGYGMVLLLTCDCVLLAFDTISHIIQYYQSIMDVQHANHLQTMDDEQMTLHYQLLQQRRQQQQEETERQQQSTLGVGVAVSVTVTTNPSTVADSGTTTTTTGIPLHQDIDDDDDDIEERSKDLDRQMDLLEQQHSRTSARIETVIFALQFMIDIITILHFLHIWTLHGIHFTFIDGVIALHLHSSATSALKKIHDRRATYRIARDMDELFHNATEHDLQNAYIAGDVCCICLGTMHYFPTKTTTATTTAGSRNKDHRSQSCRSPTCNVKKVACGHLYHTTCLREVIERARSIEAARCPLCRASFVPPKEQPRPRHPMRERTVPRSNQTTTIAIDETQRGTEPDMLDGEGNIHRRQDETATNMNDVHATDGDGGRPVSPVNMNAEDSIFRFSTEGLLPDWIPLPGFSFEIVRRPPPSSPTVAANATPTMTTDGTNADEIGERQDQLPPPPAMDRPNPQPQPAEQSVFRRIMLLAGFVQMTPEEEAVALDQLIDMFPQYDRQDLQRALRQRGTIDAVVESILLGVFVGVPHGGG